ncbi:MAG: hypothetical protein US89_C0001G0043 [Candidatus Peregrinibacteria bacterium GW2011_GWF2_38_29]|nr:MAG: hypothetical protein US89_C0001G0043 [Candidatus Peregrinibacteria bacterium GW2011_GWF2_38_29]HBB03078.1 hypothetical protein [Candidatus Peregrinibacteria bacterium]
MGIDIDDESLRDDDLRDDDPDATVEDTSLPGIGDTIFVLVGDGMSPAVGEYGSIDEVNERAVHVVLEDGGEVWIVKSNVARLSAEAESKWSAAVLGF